MNDPKKALSEEGFTRQEVDLILEKAVALQRSTEEGDFLDRGDLKEGAEAAGIRPEFIEAAIVQMREQLRREKAESTRNRRRYRMIGIAAAALIVVLFFWGHGMLNSRMTTVETQRAQLENVLQRRHDLIPNLVSVARRTAAHERELIDSISRYHEEVNSTTDFGLKQAWEEKLGGAVKELMQSVSEQPTNASTAMFTRLSDEMAGAENRIAVERKRYNDAVGEYNQAARGFFISLVRPFMGFPRSMDYFEASQGARDTQKKY